MRLVQFKTQQGERRVAIASQAPGALNVLANTETVYDLALDAIAAGSSLAELAGQRDSGDKIDYATIIEVGRLLAPLDHPMDSAHCLISGTGLTHLGSADARDQMHKKVAETEAVELTDSMKMFKMGLEGGKPADGGVGVQPEWFYKGDGSSIVAPGQAFDIENFSLDGSEEPEIVGLYLIADDGTPYRVGFALGNEFSDHVMERQNYLYLAHSKLRQCSFGPELLLGDLPADVRGNSRVLRDSQVLWEKPFLSGESNMTHTIASLEYHHFKYPNFRRAGDVHVHFFGTATLSFSDGIETKPGDMFEITAADFGRPLRNSLRTPTSDAQVSIKAL